MRTHIGVVTLLPTATAAQLAAITDGLAALVGQATAWFAYAPEPTSV